MRIQEALRNYSPIFKDGSGRKGINCNGSQAETAMSGFVARCSAPRLLASAEELPFYHALVVHTVN